VSPARLPVVPSDCHTRLMPEENLTPDDRAILAELLRETIERDRHPMSPRIRSLKAILAKFDPMVVPEIATQGPPDHLGPITLRSAVHRHMHLIAWCRICREQSAADPAKEMTRYGADYPVSEWRQKLVCPSCEAKGGAAA
jgi:hypothetical protein